MKLSLRYFQPLMLVSRVICLYLWSLSVSTQKTLDP
ncbi:hypothetical protein BMETH_988_0 [methanotrophic bacterial endosymbiont of Bathymodiolus sp.]|nr:hypothetical protein BMETH_988_0 [methanotrophic bacterial endosymbiont of Bathymodiolus sp.]